MFYDFLFTLNRLSGLPMLPCTKYKLTPELNSK